MDPRNQNHPAIMDALIQATSNSPFCYGGDILHDPRLIRPQSSNSDEAGNHNLNYNEKSVSVEADSEIALLENDRPEATRTDATMAEQKQQEQQSKKIVATGVHQNSNSKNNTQRQSQELVEMEIEKSEKTPSNTAIQNIPSTGQQQNSKIQTSLKKLRSHSNTTNENENMKDAQAESQQSVEMQITNSIDEPAQTATILNKSKNNDSSMIQALFEALDDDNKTNVKSTTSQTGSNATDKSNHNNNKNENDVQSDSQQSVSMEIEESSDENDEPLPFDRKQGETDTQFTDRLTEFVVNKKNEDDPRMFDAMIKVAEMNESCYHSDNDNNDNDNSTPTNVASTTKRESSLASSKSRTRSPSNLGTPDPNISSLQSFLPSLHSIGILDSHMKSEKFSGSRSNVSSLSQEEQLRTGSQPLVEPHSPLQLNTQKIISMSVNLPRRGKRGKKQKLKLKRRSKAKKNQKLFANVSLFKMINACQVKHVNIKFVSNVPRGARIKQMKIEGKQVWDTTGIAKIEVPSITHIFEKIHSYFKYFYDTNVPGEYFELGGASYVLCVF